LRLRRECQGNEPVDALLDPLEQPLGAGLGDALRLHRLRQLRLDGIEDGRLEVSDALSLLLRERRKRGSWKRPEKLRLVHPEELGRGREQPARTNLLPRMVSPVADVGLRDSLLQLRCSLGADPPAPNAASTLAAVLEEDLNES
jgi:hypothetical protein